MYTYKLQFSSYSCMMLHNEIKREPVFEVLIYKMMVHMSIKSPFVDCLQPSERGNK